MTTGSAPWIRALRALVHTSPYAWHSTRLTPVARTPWWGSSKAWIISATAARNMYGHPKTALIDRLLDGAAKRLDDWRTAAAGTYQLDKMRSHVVESGGTQGHVKRHDTSYAVFQTTVAGSPQGPATRRLIVRLPRELSWEHCAVSHCPAHLRTHPQIVHAGGQDPQPFQIEARDLALMPRAPAHAPGAGAATHAPMHRTLLNPCTCARTTQGEGASTREETFVFHEAVLWEVAHDGVNLDDAAEMRVTVAEDTQSRDEACGKGTLPSSAGEVDVRVCWKHDTVTLLETTLVRNGPVEHLDVRSVDTESVQAEDRYRKRTNLFELDVTTSKRMKRAATAAAPLVGGSGANLLRAEEPPRAATPPQPSVDVHGKLNVLVPLLSQPGFTRDRLGALARRVSEVLLPVEGRHVAREPCRVCVAMSLCLVAHCGHGGSRSPGVGWLCMATGSTRAAVPTPTSRHPCSLWTSSRVLPYTRPWAPSS